MVRETMCSTLAWNCEPNLNSDQFVQGICHERNTLTLKPRALTTLSHLSLRLKLCLPAVALSGAASMRAGWVAAFARGWFLEQSGA